MPPWLRFAVAGGVVACCAYVLTAIGNVDTPDPRGTTTSITVSVPELDAALLATARDDTREHRLVLEPEPLRHLLAKAIDVSPAVASALNRPDKPVPVAAVRADEAAWRGHWIYYEGVLEDLAGPREGHPIQGYSIYEATVRLADGDHAMTAFSIAPTAAVKRGSWVRIEGYLLKLRDTTYPQAIDAAPMLVGREIQPDYEDWGPIDQLDQPTLAAIDDSSYFPGDAAWHTIDEDQTMALWRLAAYVRDTGSKRTPADWRATRSINDPTSYDLFVGGKIARGAPIRVYGTLILRTSIAAPANPADISAWTVAWVQVREWGGHLIPVWVPKRVRELPERAQLEVHGFYYRWFMYEAQTGKRFRVPLFVADDLDLQVLNFGGTTKTIGLWLLGGLCVLVCLLWWSQRRAAKQSLAHSRDMDERRRRRREQKAASDLG